MINRVTLYYNIFRAAEIAACGNHSLCLVPSGNKDGVAPLARDMEILKGEIGYMYSRIDTLAEDEDVPVPQFRTAPEADIVLEVTSPSADEVIRAMHGKGETIADIAARVLKFRTTENPFVSSDLNTTSATLLKTAYERLSLQVTEVESIISVARTIAAMEGCTSIKAQHIAEAIQYKSINA